MANIPSHDHEIPDGKPTSRATELDTLLKEVLNQLIPFIGSADNELSLHKSNSPISKSTILDSHPPPELSTLIKDALTLPSKPEGQPGLLTSLASILKYSVNTSSPGFLDKLYSAPDAPGIAADLILSALNTNVHVYSVAPVLTLIEQKVTKALAALFGLHGPRAGGINVQGGSASNLTSIVVARNTLFPETKLHGNGHGGLDLVLFTSAHGHYSIEKAAQLCGLGSASVVSVPVDPVTGAMRSGELERLINGAKREGRTPFYINATAGSTVLGSFDPVLEISAVAKRHGLWLHVDGAWGGSFVFSETLRSGRLEGCGLADSIAVNPHKMLGVPVTCSFLLAKDLKEVHDANTLRAGYLFHEETEGQGWTEPNDLADMTLQCGRRGDSLKMFLSWQYYGSNGYRERIEAAYEVAVHFASLVAESPDLKLVSRRPLPCLQVCFYYAPGGEMVYGCGKRNSRITEQITKRLVSRGFMIDFAPALENHEESGSFFRAVVNIRTSRETVQRLVEEIVSIGREVVKRFG